MPAGSFSATFGRTLLWRLNRLRCMSPAELPYRAARLIAAHVESIAPRRRSIPPMDRGPWSRRWVHVPEGLDPAPYVAEADRIASGTLTIFALSFADGGVPRWNRDPKTGVEAPLTTGKLIDYRDRRLVGDIKYLWEVNRHLHLVTLAQGYALTREPRYLHVLREHLESWIRACPTGRGPNWCSALEAAIRLINWSIAWQLAGGAAAPFFAGSGGAEFRRLWLDSVYEHARFIHGYFSRHSSANNHLIGEAAGLYIAGLTWPCWPRVRDWRRVAQQILEREALLQSSTVGVSLGQQEIEHELLVAHRLLETDAVGRALQQRLALENLLRHPTPVPHPGPARPCQARDVESRRLADEMIVGRGVAREVSVYETCVLVDGIEPEPPELRPAAAGEERRGRPARELPGDRPVDEPDGRLERAAPVRAPPLWTGADPALEVLPENVQIPGFPGQRVALGQRHQVQMAIHLPQVLDVPDEAAVAIVEELARSERGFDPGLGIAIPARRQAPVGEAAREDRQGTGGDAVRLRHVRRRIEALRNMHPSPAPRTPIHWRDRPAARRNRLDVRRDEPRGAVGELGRRHAAQSIEPPQERAPEGCGERTGWHRACSVRRLRRARCGDWRRVRSGAHTAGKSRPRGARRSSARRWSRGPRLSFSRARRDRGPASRSRRPGPRPSAARPAHR